MSMVRDDIYRRAPRGARYYTLADLDGTDDEASWVTPGHVLDRHEVEWLRSLRILTLPFGEPVTTEPPVG